jgi:hypothetical protein
MKNLHLLYTDKPSKLFYLGSNLHLEQGQLIAPKNYQNIYITSDEEIKEGDWAFAKNYKGCKKIILTTDQDLIANGVQEIDDTFLKWFVENPSCEFVEVETYAKKIGVETDANGCREMDVLGKDYRITIPKEDSTKEDSTQETLEELAKDFYSDENQLMERIAFKRGYTECKENMYSEEEVVELLYKRDLYLLNRDEEVELELPNEWFEQFKKK